MKPHELLQILGNLRQADAGKRRRHPQKPLFVLWLLGRFVQSGSSMATYAEAEEPVSALIEAFGVPAASRYRAAIPFYHLERELWDLRDRAHLDKRRSTLLRENAWGSFSPEVEDLLRRELGLAAEAGQFLIHRYFTESYLEPIFTQVGLPIESSSRSRTEWGVSGERSRRVRSPAFRVNVLQAWRYRCAMCGYDGMLGREAAGLQAAHIQWHSMGGPDVTPNGLALCVLHHVLFDLGAIGVTGDLQVQVSRHYTARSSVGDQFVTSLHGRDLFDPSPMYRLPDPVYVAWHTSEVFKG